MTVFGRGNNPTPGGQHSTRLLAIRPQLSATSSTRSLRRVPARRRSLPDHRGPGQVHRGTSEATLPAGLWSERDVVQGGPTQLHPGLPVHRRRRRRRGSEVSHVCLVESCLVSLFSRHFVACLTGNT